ncbi:MAG: alkaline phosphatase family protein [Gemmatimonadaceae bacterium]|nr:alkaline phosphatase family protein [Gemmatimonadaceae bacterium]
MPIRPAGALRTVVSLALACGAPLAAQSSDGPSRSPYVILVMTDGFRWQEVFAGADPAITRTMSAPEAVALGQSFERETAVESRAALMPFVWGTIAAQGQIFGDAAVGSASLLTNGFKFSYPGYNEALTGHPDPRINSNTHPPNENRTVFEWLNTQPTLSGRVAAFATWKAFGRILNTARSHLPLFDGREPRANGTEQPRLYRRILATIRDHIRGSVRDRLTQRAVRDYRLASTPRVLFIGYGETDNWAHADRYDRYLQSAHQVDAYLAELWANVQANPATRDSTTLIVTTDHGRGAGLRWTEHGADVDGAERIWIAVMGPGIPALGVRQGVPSTGSQVAATVAAALGLDWTEAEPKAAAALPVFSARH